MISDKLAFKTQPSALTRPCGCGTHIETVQEACCDVECLVQPRYFCGQLLNDADLTAMLTWAQQKFRLGRYRTGWGIVCGLDVHASSTNPRGVVVTEGYAVDCCGEDLLVCQDLPVDLTSYCNADRCLDEAEAASLEGEDAQKPFFQPGYNKILLDLYLDYHVEGSQPQNALGRSSCSPGTDCEFSRVVESAAVRVVVDQEYASATDSRQAGYEKYMQTVINFGDKLMSSGQALPKILGEDISDDEKQKKIDQKIKEIRRMLREWFKHHPPVRVPYVKALSDQAADTDYEDLKWLEELLFYLALDYRSGWLHCDCQPCASDAGVRIARVSLGNVSTNGSCVVTGIQDSLPYRRPFQRMEACQPVAPGCYDLTRFLMQPQDEVLRLLKSEGLSINRKSLNYTRANEPNGPLVNEKSAWEFFRTNLNNDLMANCEDGDLYGWFLFNSEIWNGSLLYFSRHD